ncbi:MAG: hypothetical protein N4J56_005558 [Chroococcidiopsis sp. SAG 2025]|uniref:AEC family transporter n=1 Tax=Chroococcidiopsis sp. SAG 2025 TaxID=171389 RepID=UPI002936E2BC|nr:AEC family transporter [Chroococcidiopsis sp. SAG 2025]MDV2995904.1 hypothetical protein [Chroococcidiopsis sp. SAG 2025]
MIEITASVFCTSLGAFLFRREIIPRSFPNLLGRLLYWLGVPLQILVLTRKSNLSQSIWLPPILTIAILLLGLGLAYVSLQLLKQLTQYRSVSWVKQLSDSFYPSDRAEQGSFVLASILGNTGFIGLAIVPAFVSQDYLVWVVLYGVTHNLIGSYGLGVFLASYFGQTPANNKWKAAWRDILRVPALWAFALGYYSKPWQIVSFIDPLLQAIIYLVVPGAFLLIGMQLSRLQGIQNLRRAIIPSTIKTFVLPILAGMVITFLGFPHEARLALVLMSGMPSAFANAILAEEYNLNRPLAASTIVLSTVLLPLVIPLWLYLFR